LPIADFRLGNLQSTICNLKLINGFLGVLSDLCGEIKEDLSNYFFSEVLCVSVAKNKEFDIGKYRYCHSGKTLGERPSAQKP